MKLFSVFTVCLVLLLLVGKAMASPALPSTPAPGSSPPRLLQPEDYLKLRDVDEPNISADGNFIVYVVKAADTEKDKFPGNLWMVRWDGTENHALTNGNKGASHPRWSRDGKWIAFLSGREDENEIDQLWVLPINGGEAEKLTDLKGNVDDFAWAPDSKRIVLVVKDPDPREPEKKEKEKKTVPPIVIDRLHFKQDIEGYITDRYSHLQLLDLTSRKAEPLTSGRHDDLLPAWSPDGKQIAFASKRGDNPDRTDNWDIYCVAAEPGAKERQLTHTPEADPQPEWQSAPAWSPDGKWIAYIHGGDPKKIEYAVHALAITPVDGGEPRTLTASLDRNVVQPHWAADGKSVFCLAEDDGAQNLIRVNVAGDAPAPVTAGRRAVTAYDAAANGHVIVRTSTPDRPYEIFAQDQNELRNLSRQNDELVRQIKWSPLEETKFKSKDGTDVHGFLIRPNDSASQGKSPALLRPHGGPQSQYAAEFAFEPQLFAANGYAVILPNPRGSTGRGEKFAMGIYADWGHVDVEDDLAAVDDAVARGIADPDRLGVGGWSYGGISTNYIIATTTRFKAATSGASISNVLAGYGTDQYLLDYENELGQPWKNPEVYTRLSYPFLHADRIKTPTLFLCGQNDFNVPLLNSEQMYQALRSQDVPTQLVIYPGQFHRLKKPSYYVDRCQRYLDWYAKWIPRNPTESH